MSPKKKSERLTPLETEIMNVLWENGGMRCGSRVLNVPLFNRLSVIRRWFESTTSFSLRDGRPTAAVALDIDTAG
jgi:hypothetical protein